MRSRFIRFHGYVLPLFVLAAFAALPATSLGLDFFVNDAFTNGDVYCTAVGNDTNTGISPSSPKATIGNVLNGCDWEPGDTIWVDTGNYVLSSTISIGMLDAGLPGNPVVIQGSTNTAAGGTVLDRQNTGEDVMVISGAGNVVLRHFTMKGGRYGILISNSSQILVEGVTARDNVAGFRGESASSNQFSRCLAYVNGTGLSGFTADNSWDHGVTWGNATGFALSASMALNISNSVIAGGVAFGGAVARGDYNIFWNTTLGSYGSFDQLQYAVGGWWHSSYANPLFADPANLDFHLMSAAGRFSPSLHAWVLDAQTSPCIDLADPAALYASEPQPNGGRCNIGLYGNSPEASKSPTNSRLLALTYNDGGMASGTNILRWVAGGAATSGSVRLDYSADAGVTWGSIASSLPAASGLYIWDTTLFADSTQALWRVVLDSDTNSLDVNDHGFIVSNSATPSTNATLYALTFNAGGVASGTQLLSWAASGAATSGNVRLDYSADAGTTWSALASSVPAATGWWIWDTTLFADSTQALWRAVLEQNTNVSDVCDHVFTVGHGEGHTATSYYVNDALTNGDVYCTASGHDANSGTGPSSPKASLQSILDTYDVGPGDTIWVDTGIYDLTDGAVIAGVAGTANAPVLIQGSANNAAGGSLLRFVASTGAVTVLQGITNRSFETGSAELAVPGEPGTNGWKSYSYFPGAGGTWDSSVAQNGDRSMRLTVDETAGGGRYALISQDVDIHNTNHVSGSVAFEAWFRGDLSRVGGNGDKAGAFLKMEYLDASFAELGSPVENEWSRGRPLYGLDTSGLWCRVSISASNIPQATAFIRFAIGLNNFSSELPATGWWDNVAAVIQLDGYETWPTGAVVHIDGSSWITLSDIAVKEGMEGFKLTCADGIRLRRCYARYNGYGVLATGSVVRVDNTRISGGGAGLKVESGSVVVDGCSLWANFTTPLWATGGAVTLSNSIVSVRNWSGVGIRLEGSATYSGDYNDLVSSDDAVLAHIGGNDIATLADWRQATGKDAHSLSVDPQFADAVEGDYHLKSTAGRFNPSSQSWVLDDVDSPCIDTADPSASYSLEPAPNGGHRNIGAYGNTPDASKSADTDGDGLSNPLELYRLGSNPTNTDSDSDGMPDGDEYVAGSCATNGNSVFCFEAGTDGSLAPGSQIVLSWPSAESRMYHVDWSTNLLSGFSPLVEHLAATVPVNSYTHTVQNVVGVYYRVSCERP